MSLSPPMPPYNSADPQASFLSSSCLDFLLIELVPLAHRITTECDTPVALLANSSSAAAADSSSSVPANAHSHHQHHHHSYHPPPSSASVAAPESVAAASHHAGGGATGSVASMPRRLDEDEHLDAVHYRLESNGYRVGQGLVERFSKDRPRFNDTLDVIKFICKDLWYLVFGKHIDNLKTNHRGVYVLTDNAFRPFSRMSTETGSQAVIRAQPFLWFPCGIVRGALAALGINATVQAEVTELPGAVFQIKTIPAKP